MAGALIFRPLAAERFQILQVHPGAKGAAGAGKHDHAASTVRRLSERMG
jgi:hypothetical protein